MALQCNIDARGKQIRLLMGIFALAGAICILFSWALPSGRPIAWTLSAALLGAAGFTIFEARAGWCAFRAMGIKTRF